MTNQEFKDLLESNGFKTREHQFFDFMCGKLGITRMNINGEMQIFIGDIAIYFTNAIIEDGLLFLIHKETTVSLIPKSELI